MTGWHNALCALLKRGKCQIRFTEALGEMVLLSAAIGMCFEQVEFGGAGF